MFHSGSGYPYAVSFSATNDLKEIRNLVNQELLNFVAVENKYLNEIASELAPVATAMERFLLDSGKRLRPLFAYIGFLGTGSKPSVEILRACAALELVHVCALMHDDVMDASDTRRGAPSIHKAFEALHDEEKLSGSSEQFGISAAILLGDLALVWSAKMLHQSGIDNESMIRSFPMYDEMRVELMAGQFLDIYEQAFASESVERSLKVARYKSGKYTIERPLHFGAALGGANGKLFTLITVCHLAKHSNFAMMCLGFSVILMKLGSQPAMIYVKENARFYSPKPWNLQMKSPRQLSKAHWAIQD